MASNKQGIRTIHDAIDAKVSRVSADIRAKKSQRESEIEKQTLDKLGINILIEQIKTLTGKSPKDSYRYYEDGSPYGIALKEARKDLDKYDKVLYSIAELAENTHIRVVTGEFADAISELDISLGNLLKNIP